MDVHSKNELRVLIETYGIKAVLRELISFPEFKSEIMAKLA